MIRRLPHASHLVPLVVLLILPLAASARQARPTRIAIDVKPGDTPTTLEPKRQGLVPIVILSTKEFDAAQIDPDSVRAGAAGTEATAFKFMLEDVDRDKDQDLQLLFRVIDLGLTCQSKAVVVTGKTLAGQDVEGSEAVSMVGC